MNRFKELLKKITSKEYRWLFFAAVFLGLFIGLLFNSGSADKSGSGLEIQTGEYHAHSENTMWTCAMHPQIKQLKAGDCPICGMDLIPVNSGEDTELGERELRLTPNAIRLAGIVTSPVRRGYASREIRMSGRIEFDERRLKYITSRVPGRIDRLYVDFTGTRVRQGDHLADLYSPELITAQMELIQSVKAVRNNSSHSPVLRKNIMDTVSAAKEKLRLWGLTGNQINRIERSGEPEDHLVIYSPLTGIVIHKNVMEGSYISTGTRIYTIADLSRLWVILDAYESDLPWIRYAQVVEFETEAYPGETFRGKISFIDPVLNHGTRTVRIRVNLNNTGGRLKPEMFVKAVIRSNLSGSGTVMDPELAGKWISPMHPEIVKDGPGRCDVCGMPLVRAESLGYAAALPNRGDTPLIIPSTAPLITGRRAIVYVSSKRKEGVFEGREIVLGPEAGNFYVVKEGLEEGEEVVVNGAFKIDSDLQIQAKPSMMNPDGGGPLPGHNHGEKKDDIDVTDNKEMIIPADVPETFRLSVDKLAMIYFNLQDELSRDSVQMINGSGKELSEKLKNIDVNLLKGDSHAEWLKIEEELRDGAARLASAHDIETARKALDLITEPMHIALQYFGSAGKTYYRFHCPMAFDNNGAYWLQTHGDTRNPYFGGSMLICKDSVEKILTGKKNHRPGY